MKNQPKFTLKHPLILASKSPRRSELLAQMGFDFSVQCMDVDEQFPANLSPEEVALHIASIKNSAFPVSSSLILTADTVVAIGGKILGKPSDDKDAQRMLQLLAGRSHEVFTGVCLRDQDKTISFVDKTIVHCIRYSLAEIEYYIENYQPFDKAGSYGIQDWFGMTLVERIEGSYTNVMGLPTQKLYQTLKSFSLD